MDQAATTPTPEITFAPGARVLIRDAEWVIRSVDPSAAGGQQLLCVGVSELVREREAIFLTALEPQIEVLHPAQTTLVRDRSPRFADSLLTMESQLRQAVPSDNQIHVGHEAAMDLVPYQLDPARQALRQPRQRILIADAVGLGKTLEAGILVSELIARGRGRRILVLAVKSMLTQVQKEFWNRFTIPLTRLDSTGIQRVRRRIPTNHNPFHYYDKSIISIDTLKQDAEYRTYLENAWWDIIVIDEAHNVAERGTRSLRSRLARLLARRSDTLIMLSATPHDGRARSFASLMNMLDATAIADPERYTPEDFRRKGLVIRRFKKDIQDQVRSAFRDREIIQRRFTASPAEEAAYEALLRVRVAGGSAPLHHTHDRRSGSRPPGPLRRHARKGASSPAPPPAARPSGPVSTAGSGNATAARTSPSPRKWNPSVPSTTRWTASGTRPTPSTARFSKRSAAASPSAGEATDPEDRLVIFTERIETLGWLKQRLPKDLGLRVGQLGVLHGGMPDVKRQQAVEAFGHAKSPVRLLVCSDVASEGINLHYYCHRLIHFDMPWSLMVFAQRNGRVDRYGQERSPQIVYLTGESANPTIRGDQRILEVLQAKDEQAYRNLGDPSAFMNVREIEAEEEMTARAVAAGEHADRFDERLQPTANDGDDLLALFLGGDGAEDTSTAPPTPETAVSLFPDDLAYCAAALEQLRARHTQATGNAGIQFEVERESSTLTLDAPNDLRHRFGSFPREVVPKDWRFALTTDRHRMAEAIAESRRHETAWPALHYLWRLNPVVAWLDDRMLAAFGRREAPVLAGVPGLAPDEAVFVCSGPGPEPQGPPPRVRMDRHHLPSPPVRGAGPLPGPAGPHRTRPAGHPEPARYPGGRRGVGEMPPGRRGARPRVFHGPPEGLRGPHQRQAERGVGGARRTQAPAARPDRRDAGDVPAGREAQGNASPRSSDSERRSEEEPGQRDFEYHTYEYVRPAAPALNEFAPENEFYAGGRHVDIDRVDVRVSEIEPWRLCRECPYCENVAAGDRRRTCPRCGDAMWADRGQLREMLRLTLVHAVSDDRRTRIMDERDDREPLFYTRELLTDWDPEAVGSAFAVEIPETSFGFEYVASVTFRDLNFGRVDDAGEPTTFAGIELPRTGFRICRRCGAVQPRRKDEPARHTRSCPTEREERDAGVAGRDDPEGKRAGDIADCLYLYREFSSEAIRMLLPVAGAGGPDRRTVSFIAALELGLRRHFGGRIDHLRVQTAEYPTADGGPRQGYLVLYDTVPGGTGYLKELMTAPAKLVSVFATARDALSACVCARDPEKDGCHRCVFAYRRSRQMARTSRRTAIELLDLILEHAPKLKEVRGLHEVKRPGLLESQLEERFVEALRRSSEGGAAARVRRDLIRGRPGYLVQVGTRTWYVEPQVELGPSDGVRIPCRPDFLIRSAHRSQEAAPVAVFTDGFEYHRDRTDDDSAKRMALSRAGYLVWSLTWHDLEGVFGGAADAPDLLAGQSGAHPMDAVQQALDRRVGYRQTPVPARRVLPGAAGRLACEPGTAALEAGGLHHPVPAVRPRADAGPGAAGVLRGIGRKGFAGVRAGSVGRVVGTDLRRRPGSLDRGGSRAGGPLPRAPAQCCAARGAGRGDRDPPPPRRRGGPEEQGLPALLERRATGVQSPSVPPRRLLDDPARDRTTALPRVRTEARTTFRAGGGRRGLAGGRGPGRAGPPSATAGTRGPQHSGPGNRLRTGP